MEQALLLGRTMGSVRSRMAKLGIRVRPPWTDGDDDEVLRMARAGHTRAEIAVATGRSRQAIAERIKKWRRDGVDIPVALYDPGLYPRESDWSKEQEAELLAMWGQGVATHEIAERLHRTAAAVAQRVTILRDKGVAVPRRPHRDEWTTRELTMLRWMYDRGFTTREISEAVGRPYPATTCKINRLRRAGHIPTVARYSVPGAWGPGEDLTLRSMRASGASRQEIADTLGRTVRSVGGRIDYLGLARTG